ncbi:hypothetical protein M0R72_19210 [Candidatus Pacearchaeota archaeon]|jgi:chromosome segregation ATPase|nr:hypothetical protein [Candidatus Pacearchaeota archaeon]
MSEECPFDDDGSCKLDWKTCSIARYKSNQDYPENCFKTNTEIHRLKGEIKSLQAEIRKKDQELQAAHLLVGRLMKEGNELPARIRDLEQQITSWIADRDSWIGRYEAVKKEMDEQQAYIGRLESKFLELAEADLWDSTYNADGATARIARNKRAAKEALEKLRTG